MRPTLFGLVIACLACVAPLTAQTQITTGVIQGSVLDATGAVLPGVDVTVVNVETNLTQNRTTGGDGRFVFLQLPPGRYTVRVTATLPASYSAFISLIAGLKPNGSFPRIVETPFASLSSVSLNPKVCRLLR